MGGVLTCPIFVDVNVVMYAVGAEHSYRLEIGKIITLGRDSPAAYLFQLLGRPLVGSRQGNLSSFRPGLGCPPFGDFVLDGKFAFYSIHLLYHISILNTRNVHLSKIPASLTYHSRCISPRF
jgi:hypothetical protein